MIIECNFQRSVKTDVFSNNLGVLATVNSAFTPIISNTDLRTLTLRCLEGAFV